MKPFLEDLETLFETPLLALDAAGIPIAAAALTAYWISPTPFGTGGGA